MNQHNPHIDKATTPAASEPVAYAAIARDGWPPKTVQFEIQPDVTKVLREAREALEQLPTSETFYRDPRGDTAGPVIDSINAVLGEKT